MGEAVAAGHERVVGWEANGGFLTGTAIDLPGGRLEALPTRDAVLPVVAVLATAAARGATLGAVFADLPPRFTRAGLLDGVAVATSRAILAALSPEDAGVRRVEFEESAVVVENQTGAVDRLAPDTGAAADLLRRRERLAAYFGPTEGFGAVVALDLLDGLRVHFGNGDVAHLRPSGNAPQLRLYAVADTRERADRIVALAVAEPDGILRRLEKDLG
jgi:phosphomannomutase